MSVQPSGISWWLIGKLIYKLIFNKIALAAQNIHGAVWRFVMPKNCNHTWRHKKQATSIVCGPVSVPAFHVCSDLVHYKKNCNFFVWCIACLGNLVQSNILAKMCLKKPPFASKALNMVSPKVVLCSQFNQRRQWFSTFCMMHCMSGEFSAVKHPCQNVFKKTSFCKQSTEYGKSQSCLV